MRQVRPAQRRDADHKTNESAIQDSPGNQRRCVDNADTHPALPAHHARRHAEQGCAGQPLCIHHDTPPFPRVDETVRMRVAAQAAIMHRLILRRTHIMSRRKPAEPRTVRDFILWAEQRFAKARLYFGHGTDNARDEAVWLVIATLQIPYDELDAHAERHLNPTEQKAIRELVAARVSTRKPLAYLLHEAWFAGLKFYVDERVIVPRSLIGDFIHERFQPWIDPTRVHRILDLCTGSGCIAIAAALAFPQAQVDGADLSADALEVARINVGRHGLGA